MASTAQKVTLSAARDIPFNELVLSQANVRRIVAGASIEDIAGRTPLRSLSVRPLLDDDGEESTLDLDAAEPADTDAGAEIVALPAFLSCDEEEDAVARAAE